MSLTSRRTAMARKRYKPEEIVAKLRQVDVYRRPNRVARATPPARISRLPPAGYGKRETQGCGQPPVFLLLFTGKYKRRGGRRPRLPMPQCITTSRGVGGGAVEGLILHAVVATFQKPHARGRARASRLRAAGGARPMQGRRAVVVEHARALHRRRRARRHGGGLCARRLPASNQAGLRQ